MTDIISVKDINLEPIPGKKYWDTDRLWTEEFIYFLLVDRFHDNNDRQPANTSSNRSQGSQDGTKLSKFCGGTLKGIQNHLDYIQNLGCTAIWLSPIFENNDAPNPDSGSYHGYSIQGKRIKIEGQTRLS